MKNLNVNQEFQADLALLLRAREERYRHLDRFPELKNVTIVEEKQEGDRLHQVRHISIAESIPPVLTAILPPGADTLIETSDFHLNTNMHSFRLVPGGQGNPLFVIEGDSIYRTKGDGSERVYVIKISSSAFLVSAIVETAIAEIYSHTLEKDYHSIQNFIKMLSENG